MKLLPYNKINDKVYDIRAYIFIIFVCIVLTGATIVLPMFFALPKWIYLNIVGIYIFTYVSGLLPSIIFILFIQAVLFKVDIAYVFFSYSLILNMINIIIISLCADRERFIFTRFIISGVIMTLFSKMIAAFISNIMSADGQSFEYLFSLDVFIGQAKIYIVSAAAAYLLLSIFNKFYKKSGKN